LDTIQGLKRLYQWRCTRGHCRWRGKAAERLAPVSMPREPDARALRPRVSRGPVCPVRWRRAPHRPRHQPGASRRR